MEQQAEGQIEDYNAAQGDSGGFIGGELGNMLTQNAIQVQYREEAEALRIPQFFLKSAPDFFGRGYNLLERENLSGGFSGNCKKL